MDDGVTFEIKEVSDIMDEMEYPGVRFSMNAVMGKLITPIKIDISTGDVITPHAIKFEYKLMLEERSIFRWSYNLETILAEKLQTILSRGVLNTRMRDYYDVSMLISLYKDEIDANIFKQAFRATCKKRDTVNLKENADLITNAISDDVQLRRLWANYQRKYTYAAEIQYEDVMKSIDQLIQIIE